MTIHFEKMHALGNDFMIIDAVQQKLELTPTVVRQWGDRQRGVGFDQLLVISSADDPAADFYYGIYNADGSTAEQCGNGARCVADFIFRQGLSKKDKLVLQTKKYLMSAERLTNALYRVSLSVPDIISVQESLTVANESHQLAILSVGNPHAVLLVDDAQTAPVLTLGPLLEHHPRFSNRTNVEFLQIVDRQHVQLRVWERGAGETQACGSGAVAAVVSAQAQDLLDPLVKVTLPGGELQVEWHGAGQEVYLLGPVTRVFSGQITLEEKV